MITEIPIAIITTVGTVAGAVLYKKFIASHGASVSGVSGGRSASKEVDDRFLADDTEDLPEKKVKEKSVENDKNNHKENSKETQFGHFTFNRGTPKHVNIASREENVLDNPFALGRKKES